MHAPRLDRYSAEFCHTIAISIYTLADGCRVQNIRIDDSGFQNDFDCSDSGVISKIVYQYNLSYLGILSS